MLDNVVWWITLCAGIGFALTALFALIRIIIGPTILDRMVASDVLVTTLMLTVGAEMVINRHSNTVGLMVLLAATSVLATIMVARYVRRRQDDDTEEGNQHA